MKRTLWTAALAVLVFTVVAAGLQACGSTSSTANNVTIYGAGR